MNLRLVESLQGPEKIIHRLEADGCFRIADCKSPGRNSAARETKGFLEILFGVLQGLEEGGVAVFVPALGDAELVAVGYLVKLREEGSGEAVVQVVGVVAVLWIGGAASFLFLLDREFVADDGVKADGGAKGAEEFEYLHADLWQVVFGVEE